MPAHVNASDLMRAAGLSVDGPARWGTTPASRKPGVFVVELPDPANVAPIDPAACGRWLDLVPSLRLDGERPTQPLLRDRLASFWLPGQSLLYVGRTARSLGPRVAALYATPLGQRRPHAGGHWLKTLRELARLRLWWAETDASEEYEDALLSAFASGVASGVAGDGSVPAAGVDFLPWANLETATGERRPTGISGSLLSDADLPASGRSAPAAPRAAARRGSSGASAGQGGQRRAPAPRVKARSDLGRRAETHLTTEGLAGLTAELDLLVNVGRPEVILRVKHARELGDLRENADYEAARNEQSFLEGRIRELEQRIRTAVIIEAGATGMASLGSTVRVEHDGETSELTIVGSTESDPAAGRISQASPVGKALMGHRAGDDVRVKLPVGELLYRILEVR